jgi:hypothetical protein
MSNLGRKHDQAKPRWDLLPVGPVLDIVRVLTFGAGKYADDNWQHVPDARRRYYAAAMRHLTAWWDGERTDEETGISHLAHAGCCLLFLAWFERAAGTAQAEATPAQRDGDSRSAPLAKPDAVFANG